MKNLLESVRAEFARVRSSTDGVRMPEVQRVAREVYAQVKKWPAAELDRLCVALWESRRFEEGALVLYVYRRFVKHAGAAEFRKFTRWLDRYVDNWGLTDGLSLWLLGACIANDPSLIDQLDAWTHSRNRWKRRAAAVALVPSARRGLHTSAIFRIATPLIPDADDMVRKGVGWLLKETYPKRPRETMRFLLPWRDRAPRLVVRYAAEKMTAADRAKIMAR